MADMERRGWLEPDDVMICPVCGSEYLQTYYRGIGFCYDCGEPLVDQDNYEELKRSEELTCD